VITNGLNLSRLKADYFTLIDYIDVSFDGGPETYKNYRMAKFDKVISGIDYALSSGLKKVNALHTLNTLNIKDIDDMVKVQEYFGFDKILYSPYLITKNDGSNSVGALELFKIISELAKSDAFANSKNSFLMIDLFHLWQQGISAEDFKEELHKYPNLVNKVLLFELDPLFHGIIRVSYDDFILTPQESLHPTTYKESKLTTSQINLNDAFSMLINSYDQSRNKELELSI
jgi:sulfatase maturation enzyme AslB (radical SAM superfamily)